MCYLDLWSRQQFIFLFIFWSKKVIIVIVGNYSGIEENNNYW